MMFVGFHVYIGGQRYFVARFDKARICYTLRNVTMIPPSNLESTIHAKDFEYLRARGVLQVLRRPQ